MVAELEEVPMSIEGGLDIHHLAEPADTSVMRGPKRRAKTDKADAKLLARTARGRRAARVLHPAVAGPGIQMRTSHAGTERDVSIMEPTTDEAGVAWTAVVRARHNHWVSRIRRSRCRR